MQAPCSSQSVGGQLPCSIDCGTTTLVFTLVCVFLNCYVRLRECRFRWSRLHAEHRNRSIVHNFMFTCASEFFLVSVDPLLTLHIMIMAAIYNSLSQSAASGSSANIDYQMGAMGMTASEQFHEITDMLGSVTLQVAMLGERLQR